MSTNSTAPPLDPFMIPDVPTNQKSDTDTVSKPSLVAFEAFAMKHARRSKKPARSRKPKPQLFTLAGAFTCEQNSGQNTLDLQKAIYSLSYLMQYFTDLGNEDAEGMLINGLTFALDKIAREVGRLFVWDDILRLGGDPRVMKQQRRSDE
jgi:hypothetical protein